MSFNFEAGAGDIGQHGSPSVVKDVFLLLIVGPHGSVVRKDGWAAQNQVCSICTLISHTQFIYLLHMLTPYL